MLNAPVMEANDAVSGSMAECYVTIDGNRYNMMQLYSFESSAKVNSQDVKILGRTGIGKKPTSILAKFDAGDSLLDEELSGTFDGWDMPEEFTELSGME